MSYAVVRYVIYGGVSPIHIPSYIMNKGMAFSALITLFAAAAAYRGRSHEEEKFWGKASWHFAIIHILLSLALFSKDYFPKLFGAEKLYLTGELVIIFGVAAAYLYWRLRNVGGQPIKVTAMRALAAIMVAMHLFVMGYGGWITVSKWHGGLPPITLISFLFAVASLVMYIIPLAKNEK